MGITITNPSGAGSINYKVRQLEKEMEYKSNTGHKHSEIIDLKEKFEGLDTKILKIAERLKKLEEKSAQIEPEEALPKENPTP